MADYEVKLRVDADAAEAKKDLDEIEARGERVKRTLEADGDGGGKAPRGHGRETGAARDVGGGGGGGGGKGPRAQGREMGDEFSRVAGKAIGKAIAGFVAHQVSGIVFEGMRTYGADNTNVDRAQSAVGGAIQYGTIGATVGGPWGAAIGVLVGGITGLVGQLQKEKNQKAAVDQGIRMSNWSAAGGATAGIGRSALGALLDRAWTGNGGRGEILRGQVKDTLGVYRDARRRFDEASGWDQNSEAFKARQADFQRTQQAYFGAATEWANEKIGSIGNAKPYEAAEFGDAFGARGMYMGPQVDAASVNDKLGDRMQEQIGLLRQLVDISNQGAGYQNERFIEIVNKLDKLSL